MGLITENLIWFEILFLVRKNTYIVNLHPLALKQNKLQN